MGQHWQCNCQVVHTTTLGEHLSLDSAPRPGRESRIDLPDPRMGWPNEATALAQGLCGLYGTSDPLADTAGGWIASLRSASTRRTYAYGFKVWEAYARQRGHHPLHVTFPLADAFTRWLETAPTREPVKGGAYCEKAATGKPRSRASRATVLSACTSFYVYAVRLGSSLSTQPFAGVLRPSIDPDHFHTEDLTVEEARRLLAVARTRSPRAYSLAVLHALSLRVDSLLALNVEDLRYDQSHHILMVTVNGSREFSKPLPPVAVDALAIYLGVRKTGPLFITRSGTRLRMPEALRCLHRLAKRANLRQRDSQLPLPRGGSTDSDEARTMPQDVLVASNRAPRATERW